MATLTVQPLQSSEAQKLQEEILAAQTWRDQLLGWTGTDAWCSNDRDIVARLNEEIAQKKGRLAQLAIN